MLPTPSTSHVSFDTIYEPAEDSYLFLDTLSSASESAWLSERFAATTEVGPYKRSPPPLVVEVGTGSGVVLAFAASNSDVIFGRKDILACGVDVNIDACRATQQTVLAALETKRETNAKQGQHHQGVAEPALFIPGGASPEPRYVGSLTADLCTAFRPGSIDVLLFNPPYVPTPALPAIPSTTRSDHDDTTAGAAAHSLSSSEKFERDSYLLSLTYAGGLDGMETTNRFLDAVADGVLEPYRGVAYLLLCAQNKPTEVQNRIRRWGGGWQAEIVGRSGRQAGWEKLVIVRIWREISS